MEPAPSAAPPPMPLWVKIAIGVGIAVVVLLVAVAVLGGTEHGPGRHLGGDDEPSGPGDSSQPTGQPGTHGPQAAAHGAGGLGRVTRA